MTSSSMRAGWKKLAGVGHDAPDARWGHTSSAIDSSIIVFGGNGNRLSNDCYAYDTVSTTWSKLEMRGTPPVARFGHSATILPDSTIIIIGGRSGNKHFADVHQFDPTRCIWMRSMQPSKSAPELRAGHTACLMPDGHRIIVFGGHTSSYKYFNNVYILDTATLTWSQPEVCGAKPANRGGHCAFILQNFMFVFGGYDGKKYYNDIYSLSLDTFIWSKVEPTGSIPKVRSGHTATLSADGTLLMVFGGCGSDSNFLNDVHVLHTREMHWTQPPIVGIEPHPRFRHTCSLVESQFYVFAGTGSGTLLADMWLLDLETSPPSPSLAMAISSAFSSSSPAPFPVTPSSSPLNAPSFLSPTTASPRTSGQLAAPRERWSANFGQEDVTKDVAEIIGKEYKDKEYYELVTVPPSEPRKELDTMEMKRLYLTAMMALKEEKIKNADLEERVQQLKKELQVVRPALEKETALRVIYEGRIEEERVSKMKKLQAEQELRTTAEARKSKLERKIKKNKKTTHELNDSLMYEKEVNAKLTAENAQLRTDFEKERIAVRELTLMLKDEQTASQESVAALTKEIEALRRGYAHMMAEELDSLSLDELSDLEGTQLRTFSAIHATRSRRSAETSRHKDAELQRLQQEKSSTDSNVNELQTKLMETQEELMQKERALNEQLVVHAALQARASLLEGKQLNTLSMDQLTQLETTYHEGLRRISTTRQEHLQRELEALRKEKESLQERALCIVCSENPCNCVLMPCRHASMCTKCCSLLSRCPICRAEIVKRIETFTHT